MRGHYSTHYSLETPNFFHPLMPSPLGKCVIKGVDNSVSHTHGHRCSTPHDRWARLPKDRLCDNTQAGTRPQQMAYFLPSPTANVSFHRTTGDKGENKIICCAWIESVPSLPSSKQRRFQGAQPAIRSCPCSFWSTCSAMCQLLPVGRRGRPLTASHAHLRLPPAWVWKGTCWWLSPYDLLGTTSLRFVTVLFSAACRWK